MIECPWKVGHKGPILGRNSLCRLVPYDPQRSIRHGYWRRREAFLGSVRRQGTPAYAHTVWCSDQIWHANRFRKGARYQAISHTSYTTEAGPSAARPEFFCDPDHICTYCLTQGNGDARSVCGNQTFLLWPFPSTEWWYLSVHPARV